ncbi:Nucleolar complex protein 3 [Sparganum proliferum]
MDGRDNDSTGNGACISAAQKLLSRKKLLSEFRFKISNFCAAIIENPDDNIGKLRELLKLASEPLFLKSFKLRQLLVVSLCVVFKDILPTFKIRLPTAEEQKQQVKKETRRIWRFESILLLNYEKYVLLLQTILKDRGRRKLPKSLRSYADTKWKTVALTFVFSPPQVERLSALKCACQLFENNPTFNFSDDLLRAILPHLLDRRSSVREIVSQSLKSIFNTDTSGEPTLSVCRAVHRLARGLNYRIIPDVAYVLAGIPIKEVADKNGSDKRSRIERKLKSRRERKKDKVLAKFEKDQAETVASKSHEERLRINSQILREILFVYFKILKTTRDSDLLSAVLAGLSTYAHVINVEYVENLLHLCNDVLSNERSSLQDSLHCVHTALSILNSSSAASVLNVDPTRFYNHLYVLLGRMSGTCDFRGSATATIDADRGRALRLSHFSWSRTPAALAASTLDQRQQLLASQVEAASEEDKTPARQGIPLGETERFTDVLLSCLDLLLISRKREISTNRVLAFVKRLASVCVAVSDTACVGSMLVSLLKFITLFPKCEVLFDSETEIGGVYDPEAGDPELCRPTSAVLWELQILRSHESATVRKIVAAILGWIRKASKGGISRLSTEAIASPDITLESLTLLHPAERRVVLARSEVAALSVKAPAVTAATKRHRPPWTPSPWLRQVMAQQNAEFTFTNDTSQPMGGVDNEAKKDDLLTAKRIKIE